MGFYKPREPSRMVGLHTGTPSIDVLRMPSLCPSCTYDLSGLPDGACPECGVAFSHSQLAALAQSNAIRRSRRTSLAWLASFSLVVFMLSSGWISTLEPVMRLPAAFASLAFVLYAIGIHEQFWINKWLRWGLVSMPLAAMACFSDWNTFEQIVIVMGAMFFGIAIGFAIQHPRKAAWLITMAGIVLALRGLVMFLDGVTLHQQGFAWTDYDWPLSNHEGYGKPILVSDALWFGPAQIVVAIGSFVLAWTLSRCKSRPTQSRSEQPKPDPLHAPATCKPTQAP